MHIDNMTCFRPGVAVHPAHQCGKLHGREQFESYPANSDRDYKNTIDSAAASRKTANKRLSIRSLT